MRVDVQVSEMIRSVTWCLGVLVSWCLFNFRLHFLCNIGNHFDTSRFYHLRISCDEVLEETTIFNDIIVIQHSKTNKFEEDTSGCLHVSGSVMRHIEALVEQQLMNLSQFWFLELTSRTAAQLTIVGSLFSASIDNEFLFERVDAFFSKIFAANDIKVKSNIMAYDIFHSLERFCEDIEHLA